MPLAPWMLFAALVWGAVGALVQADAEGWFTAEQAERGAEAYGEHCATCHSPDLMAGSAYISLYGYPALTGTQFMDRWQGQSVHTLLEVVQHTMPLDAPNSLDPETYADIVAHVLNENGFPAGEVALTPPNVDAGRSSGLVLEPSAADSGARPQSPAAVDLRDAADAGAPALQTQATAPDSPPPPPEPDAPPNEGAYYTEAQATRGDAVYVESCARCHGRALQGVGVAPSLAGGNFMERWEGETLADVFFVMRILMPLDDPGSLDLETYADLLAYVLQANGFEAGDEPVPADPEALQSYPLSSDLADVPVAP